MSNIQQSQQEEELFTLQLGTPTQSTTKKAPQAQQKSLEEQQQEEEKRIYEEKVKELRNQQLKVKRAHMQIHYKNKEIDDIQQQIEDQQLVLQHYQQYPNEQVDIYRKREYINEFTTLQEQLEQLNEQMNTLEVNNWDKETVIKYLKKEFAKAGEQDQIIKSDFKKNIQDETEKLFKKNTTMQGIITETDNIIKKMEEEHLENTDQLSALNTILQDQLENNKLLQEQFNKQNSKVEIE